MADCFERLQDMRWWPALEHKCGYMLFDSSYGIYAEVATFECTNRRNCCDTGLGTGVGERFAIAVLAHMSARTPCDTRVCTE